MSRKNAKELMLEFTAFSLRDLKKAAEMFAEDGAFEIPILPRSGFPNSTRDAKRSPFFSNSCAISFQASNSRILGC